MLQKRHLQQLVVWLTAPNKLTRKLKSQPVKPQVWPLTKPLRIIGSPGASYGNNEDGSPQRGMTVFLAELRQQSSKDGMSYGGLTDYESQKIKKTVLSTTVAELYYFMKCFGSCQFLRGLWMDLLGEVADIHMRTAAKNLVTTARTNHLPAQKRKQSIWFQSCERKLVQEVYTILLTLTMTMLHPDEVPTSVNHALRTRTGRSWPQQKESVKLWKACQGRSCGQIPVKWQVVLTQWR